MAEEYSIRRLLWAAPLTAVSAGLIDLLIYVTAKALGQQFLIAGGEPVQAAVPMPPVWIVVAVLAASSGAAIIFAFLLKVTHTPLPPFLSISAAALLVSFGGPFSLTGATSLATKLLLGGMNIVAGVVIVGGLIFFTREKPNI